jgi:mevalonate pyrophosphate decarboxylase
MNMNYMINDPASKEVAIAFAKWTTINGMWQSDLTFDEQYECWMKELDDQAHDARLAHDSVDDEDFGAYIMARRKMESVLMSGR